MANYIEISYIKNVIDESWREDENSQYFVSFTK